jgi:hypothetical protein
MRARAESAIIRAGNSVQAIKDRARPDKPFLSTSRLQFRCRSHADLPLIPPYKPRTSPDWERANPLTTVDDVDALRNLLKKGTASRLENFR